MKKYILCMFLSWILCACASHKAATPTPAAPKMTAVWQDIQNKNLSKAKQALVQLKPQAQGRADYWHALAVVNTAQGDLLDANEDFLEALTIQPSNPEIHNNYGVLLCEEREYDLAFRQFHLAFKQYPQVKKYLAKRNAAICAMRKGDTQLALKWQHLRS